jgi:hypothetical protein
VLTEPKRRESPARIQKLTESQVAAELGLDKLQLHLAAASHRIGLYDPATHLLVFTEEEVNSLAAKLGISRRPRREPSAEELARIPEPSEE